MGGPADARRDDAAGGAPGGPPAPPVTQAGAARVVPVLSRGQGMSPGRANNAPPTIPSVSRLDASLVSIPPRAVTTVPFAPPLPDEPTLPARALWPDAATLPGVFAGAPPRLARRIPAQSAPPSPAAAHSQPWPDARRRAAPYRASGVRARTSRPVGLVLLVVTALFAVACALLGVLVVLPGFLGVDNVAGLPELGATGPRTPYDPFAPTATAANAVPNVTFTTQLPTVVDTGTPAATVGTLPTATDQPAATATATPQATTTGTPATALAIYMAQASTTTPVVCRTTGAVASSTGMITTNGAGGVITYYWQRSMGVRVNGVTTLQPGQTAGSVTDQWSLRDQPAGMYWDELVITAPEQILSNRARVQVITCT